MECKTQGECERAKPSRHRAWIVGDCGVNKRAFAAQAGALCALWLPQPNGNAAPQQCGFPNTVVGHGSGSLLLLFFFSSFIRVMDAQQLRGSDPHARTTFSVGWLGRHCTDQQKQNHVSLFLEMVCAFVTAPDVSRIMATHRMRRPFRWLCTDWVDEQRAAWNAFAFIHVLRECKWDRWAEGTSSPLTPERDINATSDMWGGGDTATSLLFLHGPFAASLVVRCDCRVPCRHHGTNSDTDVWTMTRGQSEPSIFQYQSMPDTFDSMADWLCHIPLRPFALCQFRPAYIRIYDLVRTLVAFVLSWVAWLFVCTLTAAPPQSSSPHTHPEVVSYSTDVALECALRQRSTDVHWTVLDASFAIPLHQPIPDFSPQKPTFTFCHWQLYDSRELTVTHLPNTISHGPLIHACCAQVTSPERPLERTVFQQCVNWGMIVLWDTLEIPEENQKTLW